MHGQIQGLDNRAASLSQTMTVIQKHQEDTSQFLQAFTVNFEKFLQADEKKWEAQKEFNEIIKEYIEKNDKKMEWIMKKTGVGNLPLKQVKLESFEEKPKVEEKKEERDAMYG